MSAETHPGAGTLPDEHELIDLQEQRRAFQRPARAPVAFGTSGHRGSAENGTFNEEHIVAVARAIAVNRREDSVQGPLFIGYDSHALSRPAADLAINVLLDEGVDVVVQTGGEMVATPVISRAILRHNSQSRTARADGIVVTPSHNPPTDGGIKYNPPHGGPAASSLTARIEELANSYLDAGVELPAKQRRAAREVDLNGLYVAELSTVLDMDAIAASGVRIAVDPLGGAALPLYERLERNGGLNLELRSREVDPTFRFVPRDHDGLIRMDCSSSWAMSAFLKQSGGFDVCIGNDPDADRHGVAAAGRLLSPNAYLALAIDYLLQTRSYPASASLGRTVVTTRSIDLVAATHGRGLHETPVGFKWFVDGLHGGDLCCGAEESAGLSFLARDGSAWSTDKDGVIAGLLAAEMIATTQRSLSDQLTTFAGHYGDWSQSRRDLPAEDAMVRALKSRPLPEQSASGLTLRRHARDGNNMGGLIAEGSKGWFAMRPSGTEPIVKIYAESSEGSEAVESLLAEAAQLLHAL